MRATVAGLVCLLVAAGAVVPAVSGAQPVSRDGSTAVPSLATGTTDAVPDCSFPVTRTDATGVSVTVETEPEQVVVLAPSAAQVLWEIGARETVVGMPVNQYTAYLNGSEERTNIVTPQGQPNLEQIVALSPDLVIAPNVVDSAAVAQLRDAGLTVYRAGFGESLDDIYTKTEVYGRLVGECEGAQRVVAETRANVSAIRAAVGTRDRPRVLYYFFNFTAGDETFVHGVVGTAGGDNVAANAGITGYRQLNPEVVAERDPEWIVVPSGARVPQREPYTNTTAVRTNQILVVNANYISQPGPRVVIPMRRMAERFHPGAFAATPAPEMTPTPTPATATGETPQSDRASTTPASANTETPTARGPGFGIVAAAGAVILAGLLARRWKD